MTKVHIHNESLFQHLLTNSNDMPVSDLEIFIKELNALVIKKRMLDVDSRSKNLLFRINKTVLPENDLERYINLQEKMEINSLSDIEYKELLKLVAKEEKLRNKRFTFLLELSQLRGISLSDLMTQLGFNTPNHA